ncbi:MAG: hypothetical protein IBX64_12980 [Actinobacteria bacterium]|nr:hypothetical protein [Actinomycetota bacterium]
MKAYIGDEAGGAAVVVGVKDGKVKVAKSVTLQGKNIRDPKVVERAHWLRFDKGVPKGWRRAPEYDDYVNQLYFERLS